MAAITKWEVNPSLTDTPARINMRTGVLQVSEGFFLLPVEFRIFILCHEYGHRLADTHDEKIADSLAFRFYANLGYPLSKCVLALAEILNKNSSYHISRTEAVYQLAQDFDTQVYQPYKHLNLQSQHVRKFVMRRHRNNTLREVGDALRSKDFEAAKRLIGAELSTLPPGSPEQKAYFHLNRLASKAEAGKLCTKLHTQKPKGKEKPKSYTEAGFNDEEEYRNFTEELEGFADEMVEIAQFNDEFDAFVDDLAADFSGEDGFEAFVSEDHADYCGFADDLADFSDDMPDQADPFRYASLKGDKKAKRDARKAKNQERKDTRLANKTKMNDAKAAKKMAQATATVTKADAKKVLADQGIGGNKVDFNNIIDKAAGVYEKVAGGAVNAVMSSVGLGGGGGGGGGGGDAAPLVEGQGKSPSEKTATPATPATPGIPIWVWIVGGVVVVAGIGLAIWHFTKPKKGTAKAK